MTFAPVEYTVTYLLNGGENASENIVSFTVESEAFTLLPATYAGHLFEGWYIGENKVEIISEELLGNITLEAKWSKETYTIGYEINTNHGTITPAKMSAEYGETIEYTVTANEGYTLKEIKVNGTAVSHENGAFSVTVSENVTVSVSFEETKKPTPPTDNGNENGGEENGGEGEKESGCGSLIGVGTGAIATVAFAAACLLRKKKED